MNKKIAATIAVGVLAVTMLTGWRGYGCEMDAAKVSRIVDARGTTRSMMLTRPTPSARR